MPSISIAHKFQNKSKPNIEMIQSIKNQLGAFPIKLYEMLEDAEQRGFDHIVSWIPNGTGFRVHNPDELVEKILPKYFNQQTRYKSFQRQMNMYEFKMLRKAPKGSHEEQFKGAIFHPLFVRGKKELCMMIVRKSVPRTNSFRLASMDNNIPSSFIYGDQLPQSSRFSCTTTTMGNINGTAGSPTSTSLSNSYDIHSLYTSSTTQEMNNFEAHAWSSIQQQYQSSGNGRDGIDGTNVNTLKKRLQEHLEVVQQGKSTATNTPTMFFATGGLSNQQNNSTLCSNNESSSSSLSWYKQHADCLLDYAAAISSSQGSPLVVDSHHTVAAATVESESEWYYGKKDEQEEPFASMQWYDCDADETDVIESIIDTFGRNRNDYDQEEGGRRYLMLK